MPNSTRHMKALSYVDFCERAGGEIDRLADLVSGADLAAPVPWSRSWQLADLVRHVGVVHRWAARLIVTGARRYLPMRDTDDFPARARPSQAAAWLRAGRDPLLNALRAADPAVGMWAWGADQHVRFWGRRMFHETGIHRADAELALGLNPSFALDTALDGVEEFLANMWRARAWRRSMVALRGNGETLGLFATDVTRQWRVELGPDSPCWSAHSRQRPPTTDVRISGPAGQLYLLVWNRLPPDAPGLRVRGDTELLRHWRRYSAV